QLSKVAGAPSSCRGAEFWRAAHRESQQTHSLRKGEARKEPPQICGGPVQPEACSTRASSQRECPQSKQASSCLARRRLIGCGPCALSAGAFFAVGQPAGKAVHFVEKKIIIDVAKLPPFTNLWDSRIETFGFGICLGPGIASRIEAHQ